MDRTLFIIRNVNIINDDTVRQVRILRQAYPDSRIVCAADCINKNLEGHLNTLKELNVDILEITHSWITSQNLPYYGKKTGWVCGDYAYYIALAYDWDYAWLLEPDVGLLNGAEMLFKDWAKNHPEDLIAGRLAVSDSSWYWKQAFSKVYPEISQVGSMLFCISRASRKIIESALRLRQLAAQNSTAVNDESILASTAFNSPKFDYANLSEIYPEVFKYYTYKQIFPPQKYLNEEYSQPLIAHKVISEDNFLKYVEQTILNSSPSVLSRGTAIEHLQRYGNHKISLKIMDSLLRVIDKLSFSLGPQDCIHLIENYAHSSSIARKISLESEIDSQLIKFFPELTANAFTANHKLAYLYLVSTLKDKLLKTKPWIWNNATLVCDVVLDRMVIAFDITQDSKSPDLLHFTAFVRNSLDSLDISKVLNLSSADKTQFLAIDNKVAISFDLKYNSSIKHFTHIINELTKQLA